MTTNKIISQTESLHARIPQDILEELDKIAKSLGRSRNWVFNEALKQYVELQQWQIDVTKKRLQESESNNVTFMLHDDVMKRQEKRLKKKLDV